MLQTAKFTQEQAVASWIDHLNQLRVDEMMSKLARQGVNLQDALSALEELKTSVGEVIASNRGGDKGLHGFIAERAQVGIENARKLVEGLKPEYFLVDDNGPVDLTRAGIDIQQKFVQANLGLNAIREHLEKYPQFVQNGGIYQIPKDYYEKLQYLLKLSPEEIKKLTKADLRLHNALQQFLKDTGIEPKVIEPSVADYKDVQKGRIDDTIKSEQGNIKEKDKELRGKAYQEGKASFKQGAQAAAVGAVVEGGMTFCLAVAKKLKSGKKLSDFSEQDWKDVGIDTGKGTVKGAVRGASIYTLTNFTATPAAVASALLTASFGIAAQAMQLRQGKISEEDFLINAEVLCLDVTVSAVASLMGQVLIPVPALGAIIGNAAGMFMYGIAKNTLSTQEQALITNYNNSIKELNEKLDEHFRELIEMLKREFEKFKSIAELAFDLNVNVAFAGSVQLAQYVGCSDERILKDKKAIDAFFS